MGQSRGLNNGAVSSPRRTAWASTYLDSEEIARRLWVLKNQYNPLLRPEAFAGQEYDVFRTSLVYREKGLLIDLGGGLGTHNGVLAELGMTVYVVDLLEDYFACRGHDATSVDHEVQLLKSCGVEFIHADLAQCDLTTRFAENSVDIVTSFHCIEHLHQSPRLVLESAVRVLKRGGTLLIEVPNAANLRKRLALLCGKSNYCPYNAYYYSNPYVGHVREYTAGDLVQLAKNLGAQKFRVFGRNYGPAKVNRFLRGYPDLILRSFPSLCYSLSLEILKP